MGGLADHDLADVAVAGIAGERGADALARQRLRVGAQLLGKLHGGRQRLPLLGGERGGRAQVLAARTLALVATPKAVDALRTLVRSNDRALRQLGLRNLSRVRVQQPEPVMPRATAHRLFVRELREYRAWLTPALRLEMSPDPELHLLAESYREFADMALERAVRALATWYDPTPLFGAFERLRTRNLSTAAPALEYLSQVLPKSAFRPLSRMFEEERPDRDAQAPPEAHELAEWIRAAWESGDAWLRACAVHVSRHAPELRESAFELRPDESPVVRAEVKARFGEEERGHLAALAPRTASG